MSFNFFNPSNKSWKMYVKYLTSISGDDIHIKPHDNKDLLLEVSANNNIIFIRGENSYGLDELIGGGSSDFRTTDISTSLIPKNPNSIDLGTSSKYWNNAYINTISASNISVSGILVLPSTSNILSNNVTVTSTQLGYLSGTTRTIQTQINELSNNKANIDGPIFTGIVRMQNISASNISVSGTLVLPSTSNIISNNVTVTSTQLGYLSGTTHSIQNQIDDLSINKANLTSPIFNTTVTIQNISATNITVNNISVSGNLTTDISNFRITTTHRIYQEISGGINWNSVNGYYGLAKDTYPGLNPSSSGFKAVNAWTIRTAAENNEWSSVCWSPELALFVAISWYGANQIMTSPNGINWTSQLQPEPNFWTSICWSPELMLFVAVATNGSNRVMISSNGTLWTRASAAQPNTWMNVCWSSELRLFVAVSQDGANRVMTSNDGINWRPQSEGEANMWRSVCWSSELRLFVAVAESGTNRVMTSNNGITWIATRAIQNNSWESVCWSKELGIFVAVSKGKEIACVMYSSNGIVWTSVTINNNNNNNVWHSVCWSAQLDLFVAVATTGYIMYSSNGINWTITISTLTNSINRRTDLNNLLTITGITQSFAADVDLAQHTLIAVIGDAYTGTQGSIHIQDVSGTTLSPNLITLTGVFQSGSQGLGQNITITNDAQFIVGSTDLNGKLHLWKNNGTRLGYIYLPPFTILGETSATNIKVKLTKNNVLDVPYEMLLAVGIRDGASGNIGKAHVYSINKTNGAFSLVQEFQGVIADNGFGANIGISPNGVTLVIQAASYTTPTAFCYIYTYNYITSQYTLTQTINGQVATTGASPPNPRWDDFPGSAIAFNSSSSNTMALASFVSSFGVGQQVGYVDIYNRISNKWILFQRIDGTEHIQYFGWSLGFDATGSSLIIGSNGNQPDMIVYRKFTDSSYVEVANYTPGPISQGRNVALSADGTRYILSSWYENARFYCGDVITLGSGLKSICWSPELGIFTAVAYSSVTANNRVITSSLKGRPPTSYNMFGDETITTSDIANNSITNIKLQGSCVTTTKIADNTIIAQHFQGKCIDSIHIKNNAILGSNISYGTIDFSNLSASAISNLTGLTSGGGTSDFSATDISTSLIPKNPNSIDLGTTTKPWNNAYITNILSPKVYYELNNTSLSWEGHYANALSLGKTLAIILNAEQNEEVRTIAAGNDVYIGGKRKAGSSNYTGGTSIDWEWVNGDTWSYTNWQGGEPNDINEIYLLMFSSGTWNDTFGGGNGPAVYMSGGIVTINDINVTKIIPGLIPITIPQAVTSTQDIGVQLEYRYYIYLDVGSYTFTPQSNTTVDIFIVGGGGGGGVSLGGGGGGGGVIFLPNVTLTNGTTYNIIVGDGGTSQTNGNPSSFDGAIAAGGGAGGGPYNSATSNGSAGGSGGGASGNEQNGVIYYGGATSGSTLGTYSGTIYGNRGGSLTAIRDDSPVRGAGGGGAGAAALDTNPNTLDTYENSEGSGGIGIMNNMYFGNDYYWGGGGGGAAYFDQGGGYGGLGGGGGGSVNNDEGRGIGYGGGSSLNAGGDGGIGGNYKGGDGGPNTGGGGGSGSFSNGQGGMGGSGIVIIREKLIQYQYSNNSTIGTYTNFWQKAFISDINATNISIRKNIVPSSSIVTTKIQATGTYTDYDFDSSYSYYTYRTVGTSYFIPGESETVDVLIVGGGGGGGITIGGGGGGGGVIYLPSVRLSGGMTYNITVGDGGAGQNNGNPSSFNEAIAGGGGAGGAFNLSYSNGFAGGSGGGACANSESNSPLYTGGASIGNSLGPNYGTIYGNRGGSLSALRNANSTQARSAGGGGAGAAALNTNPLTLTTSLNGEGSGGVGIMNDIYLGYPYYWGGGGGGAAHLGQNGGYGGLGGGGGGAIWPGGGIGYGGGSSLNAGGNGGVSTWNGSSGDGGRGGAGGNNTGGGGGGGSWNYGLGGKGGSGIVIIRSKRTAYSNNTNIGLNTQPWNNAVINNLTVNKLTIGGTNSVDVINNLLNRVSILENKIANSVYKIEYLRWNNMSSSGAGVDRGYSYAFVPYYPILSFTKEGNTKIRIKSSFSYNMNGWGIDYIRSRITIYLGSTFVASGPDYYQDWESGNGGSGTRSGVISEVSAFMDTTLLISASGTYTVRLEIDKTGFDDTIDIFAGHHEVTHLYG